MEYTVKIEKRHCIGAFYTDIFDCPLCRAIKEQLSNFKLHYVSVGYVEEIHSRGFLKSKEFRRYNFPMEHWNCAIMHNMAKGEIESVVLTLSRYGDGYGEVKYSQPKYEDITKQIASLQIQEDIPDTKIKELK